MFFVLFTVHVISPTLFLVTVGPASSELLDGNSHKLNLLGQNVYTLKHRYSSGGVECSVVFYINFIYIFIY